MVDVETMRDRVMDFGGAMSAVLDELADLRREVGSLRVENGELRKRLMPPGWARTLGECIDSVGGFHDEALSPERALGIIRDALRTRLMPEGYEWPKFEDGEPVRRFDKVQGVDPDYGVRNFLFFGPGQVKLDAENCKGLDVNGGRRVKRPVPPATPSPGRRDTVAQDSWERWREDAALMAWDYCDQRDIDYDGDSDAEAKQVEELERRAKALAGVE